MKPFESFDDITCALSTLHDSYELLGAFLSNHGNLANREEADGLALSTLSVLNQTLSDCVERIDVFHQEQDRPKAETA